MDLRLEIQPALTLSYSSGKSIRTYICIVLNSFFAAYKALGMVNANVGSNAYTGTVSYYHELMNLFVHEKVVLECSTNELHSNRVCNFSDGEIHLCVTQTI